MMQESEWTDALNTVERGFEVDRVVDASTARSPHSPRQLFPALSPGRTQRRKGLLVYTLSCLVFWLRNARILQSSTAEPPWRPVS